jgi:hypothetical protein
MYTNRTHPFSDRGLIRDANYLITNALAGPLIKLYDRVLMGWLLMLSLCLTLTSAHASPKKMQQSTSSKYLIATVSGQGFEPLIATTDAIVQRFLITDAQPVEQRTPIVELYPYLYPKSQSIFVRARKPGLFIERTQIQLGSKVNKGDILGYIHFDQPYQFDTLISDTELAQLKSKKLSACVQFNADCLAITLTSEHVSEYAEIKRARFTLTSQQAKPTQIQLLPDARLILELKLVEASNDKQTTNNRPKIG